MTRKQPENLCFPLGHAQIPLGAMIGEGDMGLTGEAEHRRLLLTLSSTIFRKAYPRCDQQIENLRRHATEIKETFDLQSSIKGVALASAAQLMSG